MKRLRAQGFGMLRVLWAIVASILVVPAVHGQQEVDPTWYDPAPESTKAVPQGR
jgi:hypothetical protein